MNKYLKNLYKLFCDPLILSGRGRKQAARQFAGLDRLVQMVPREMFEDNQEIEVGMQFHSGDPDGNVTVVTVTSVTDDSVTVDANHPLAGVSLNFAVTIVEVRDATSEELAHGHVHGAGGHHHD